MNYSRAGGPIPVNQPGKDKRIDDKMEILLEQEKVLEEAISHYTKKAALKDWWEEWYENSLKTYKKQLEKTRMDICNTSGVKYEPSKEKGPTPVEGTKKP